MINYAHLKSQMIQLLDLLRSILYPNVFDAMEEAHSKEELEAAARRQLREILERIYREPPQYDDVIDTLFSKLPAIRDTLDTDVQAAYEGRSRRHLPGERSCCAYPAFEAISIFRIAHELYLMKVPMLPRMMTEYAHSLTGIDIHPGATIGPYFFIDHGTGVVIGETTVIGEHVKLHQGVTLGAKSFAVKADGTLVKGNKRHPNIGSNVVIYAGATILGGDTYIGDNCVIGGNVWLTHSVEPGKRVLTAREQTEFVTTDI
ncbi:MAG: serine acetyltransferase [Dysosmobacter sp.]